MNEPSLNGRKKPEAADEMALESAEDVRAYLNAWRDPVADPMAKTRLLTVLHAEGAAQFRNPVRQQRSLRSAWLILWSQTRVIHKLLWIASALVISLGALVTLIFRTPAGSDASLPLAVVAPIVAAASIAARARRSLPSATASGSHSLTRRSPSTAMPSAMGWKPGAQ